MHTALDHLLNLGAVNCINQTIRGSLCGATRVVQQKKEDAARKISHTFKWLRINTQERHFMTSGFPRQGFVSPKRINVRAGGWQFNVTKREEARLQTS